MVFTTTSISWFKRGRNRKKDSRKKEEVSEVPRLDFPETLLRNGASVGLKPNDIWEMHFWEYNNYIKGYEEVMIREDEKLITLAYHVAGFVNAKKKPKSLSYYLNKIRNGRKLQHQDEVDKDKAREVYQTIERLKKLKKIV